MKFITKEGLKQLDFYSYKSGAYTWLDNKLNPCWEYFTQFLPMTIAPNLVTFIGWIFMILSYGVMLMYDYTFKEQIPRWTFFFAAACIFIYTNLDAMDGKQARRTKSSSPLGQLFDHGCDSFSLNFFVLAACQATKLQRQEVLFVFVAAQVSFWTSNWIQYHTGILQACVGNFGVTESELICMLIHLITGIFGQNIWGITVSSLLPQVATTSLSSSNPLFTVILRLEIKTLISYSLGTLMILLSTFSYIKTISQNKQSKLKVSCEWVSLMLIVVMEIIWIQLPIYNQFNGLILVNFGIIASLIVCKVIISSVTKMKLELFHKQIIPFLVSTALLIRYNYLGMEKAMVAVFWMCLIVNLAMTLLFLSVTIKQITSYLGIQCFSLKKVLRKMD